MSFVASRGSIAGAPRAVRLYSRNRAEAAQRGVRTTAKSQRPTPVPSPMARLYEQDRDLFRVADIRAGSGPARRRRRCRRRVRRCRRRHHHAEANDGEQDLRLHDVGRSQLVRGDFSGAGVWSGVWPAARRGGAECDRRALVNPVFGPRLRPRSRGGSAPKSCSSERASVPFRAAGAVATDRRGGRPAGCAPTAVGGPARPSDAASDRKPSRTRAGPATRTTTSVTFHIHPVSPDT